MGALNGSAVEIETAGFGNMSLLSADTLQADVVNQSFGKQEASWLSARVDPNESLFNQIHSFIDGIGS